MADRTLSSTKVQIDRISKNEQRLDRCSDAVKALAKALQQYRSSRQDLAALDAYYGSPEWFSDREAEEQGAFPKGLRCGVLSEDAVYDLLTEVQALKEELRDLLAMDCGEETL